VTTDSEQARRLFLEARDAFEGIREAEARLLSSKAIRIDPDFALAYLYLGRTTEDPNERARVLQKALDLSNNVSTGELLLIEAQEALLRQNDRELWAKRTHQLVRKYPRDKRALQEMGNIYYFYYNDMDKALSYYLKGLEVDQDFAPIHNMMGYTYRAKEQFEQAEEAFRTYIKLNPDEPNPYDSMGELLTKMGRFQDAIPYYQKAIKRNLTFSFSQGKIGINLGLMGKFDEGRAAIQKAIDMAVTPTDKIVETGRNVRLYIHEGDYDQALAQMQVAIQTAADSGLLQLQADLIMTNCIMQIEAGHYETAEECLSKCKVLMTKDEFPGGIKQAFDRGIVWREAVFAAKRGNFEEALAQAAQLRDMIEGGLNPDDMQNAYFPLMGMIHLEKEAYIEAIKYFQDGDLDNPYMQYYYGLALAGAGKQEKAAKSLRRAAHWNEDLFGFAYVRAKALKELGE
jgi:tetratricopeptide (TPR) repeat protein